MLSPEDRAYLSGRMSPERINRRLDLEEHYASRTMGHGRTFLHIENVLWFHRISKRVLRAVRLYGRGYRNALQLGVIESDVSIRRLPDAFDGYRIAHLSDLHIDIDPGVKQVLCRRLREIEADACVMTGDFRAWTFGDCKAVLRDMREVMQCLDMPAYAVLGNHDQLEMVRPLEDLGIHMLLNESTVLRRGGEAIYLAGVDDPHFFEMDDMDAACAGIPPDAVRLLLAHSPEAYRAAADRGIDVYWCGHTHGGQVCLPFGVPLVINTHCPARLARGAWQHGGMQGYTSPGIGASSLAVRFNCPPAVVIHRLRKEAHQ